MSKMMMSILMMKKDSENFKAKFKNSSFKIKDLMVEINSKKQYQVIMEARKNNNFHLDLSKVN
jgi:hypothetical protein